MRVCWPEGAHSLGVCQERAVTRSGGARRRRRAPGGVTRSRGHRRRVQPRARAAVRAARQGLEETREDRMRDRERIRAADAFDDFDRRVEKHWTEKARPGGGRGRACVTAESWMLCEGASCLIPGCLHDECRPPGLTTAAQLIHQPSAAEVAAGGTAGSALSDSCYEHPGCQAIPGHRPARAASTLAARPGARIEPGAAGAAQELGEMTERDWRIFREDFSIAYKGVSSGMSALPIRNWKEATLPPPVMQARAPP